MRHALSFIDYFWRLRMILAMQAMSRHYSSLPGRLTMSLSMAPILSAWWASLYVIDGVLVPIVVRRYQFDKGHGDGGFLVISAGTISMIARFMPGRLSLCIISILDGPRQIFLTFLLFWRWYYRFVRCMPESSASSFTLSAIIYSAPLPSPIWSLQHDMGCLINSAFSQRAGHKYDGVIRYSSFNLRHFHRIDNDETTTASGVIFQAFLRSCGEIGL